MNRVRSLLFNDMSAGVYITLAVLAILVPLSNLGMPVDTPFHVSTYIVTLLGKYLCYALLALSLDLVWGYCGILSLGHGAFFALGGYAMGMHLMRMIGPRGVYGDPVLPDFMVFLNYKSLPWYWLGFDHFAFAMLMVVLVPGLLAFAFGALAFRSRVSGVYFSIITQAMTFALMLAFFRNDMGLGGNNGLTDFKDIFGVSIQDDRTRNVFFVASILALAGGYAICRAIVTSKLGKVLVAVRDAESRTRFLGYRVDQYKLFVWVVSACLAGIAGALYVPQVGIINPSEFAPAASIEAVIWVAVGGRGTLIGAMVGAVLVNAFKSWFTGAIPELWLFALGALFVLVTLFLPRGIVGTLTGAWQRKSAPPSASEKAAADFGRGDAGKAAHEGWRMTEPITNALLYLNDVTVSFDGFRALNALSLTIDKGEMRAIIGPNGAGKTTMMDVITGKTRPDEGEVLFSGSYDLTKLDEARIANLGIGRKFQKPTVFEGHTVWDNLRLALTAKRGVFATLLATVTPDERRNIEEILQTVHLTDVRSNLAANLSHGQKQWLEIGMLLAQDPQLLLVDEPVAGMTDAETAKTGWLLREINKTRTVVVVEHDMTFVRALDVKVTVLHEGSVLAEGPLDYVSADERVIEVYLGR